LIFCTVILVMAAGQKSWLIVAFYELGQAQQGGVSLSNEAAQ
jgi:hypothetical protein